MVGMRLGESRVLGMVEGREGGGGGGGGAESLRMI